MKKCLFLMLMMVSMSVMAQEEPIQFDEVVKAEGKSVPELYTTIKMWVATNYNSAQDVIQMDDAQNGILICKGAFEYDHGKGITGEVMDGWVDYTLKVQVREGRYKVSVGNFVHKANPVRNGRYDWSLGLITTRERAKAKGAVDARQKKAWKNLKTVCKVKAYEIIEGLKAATEQGAGLMDTDDDW